MSKARKFGKAEVEVSIRDRVGVGLKAIEKRMRAFGKGIEAIGTKVTVVGAGLTAAGLSVLGPIVAAVNSFAEAGDALDKMAARTGVSVEALAELGFAAEQGGSNLKVVELGLKGLSQFLYRAATGSSEAARALGMMGVSLQELQSLTPEQQFMRVADALSQIEDAGLRGAIAQTVFAESGRQLLPMLQGLQAIRDEARELGLVLSSDATKDAAELTDALNRIKRTGYGAFLQLGAAVARPLITVMETVTEITKRVNEWVAKNHEAVRVVAAVAVGFVTVGSVAAAVGVTLIGVGAAIAAIGTLAVTAFSALTAGIGILLSPVGLLVGGLTAIAGYLAATSTAGQTLFAVFGELGRIGGSALSQIATAISQGNFAAAFTIATTAARDMLNTVIEGINKIFPGFAQLASAGIDMWNTIVGAIRAGLLEDAAALAFTGLEIVYQSVVLTMRQAWNDMVFFMQDRWADVVEFIGSLGMTIYTSVASVFDQLGVALMDGFDTAFVFITGLVDRITTDIAKAIITAQEFFGLFSKEQADAIRGSLDAELANRAAGRQSGLGQRMGDRAAGAAQRDQARNDFASVFAAGLSDMVRPTRQVVDSTALTEAQARFAEQRQELDRKIEEAQQETKRPPPAIIPAMMQQAGQQAGRMKAIGTSSAAAVSAGALGFSSRPLEDTARNTAELVKLARKQNRQPAPGFAP